MATASRWSPRLTSGPNSDLVGAVSATSLAGGGFYSAYVGAVVDLARVLGNLHTASYVYIPALALPKSEQMNLKLNNPPSFRKPMSVIVIGLPAVEAAQLPPLRAVNADQVFCLQKSSLVLPVEGAPLVFSSDIAHDFFLHIPGKDGKEIKLPARADATSGGFVIDTHSSRRREARRPSHRNAAWRFGASKPYEGPNFHLRTSRAVALDRFPLPNKARSSSAAKTPCTCNPTPPSASMTSGFRMRKGKEIKTTWKVTKPDELELKVALKDQPAGPMKVKLRQFGLTKPDELSLASLFRRLPTWTASRSTPATSRAC